jgi:hypothetical protein
VPGWCPYARARSDPLGASRESALATEDRCLSLQEPSECRCCSDPRLGRVRSTLREAERLFAGNVGSTLPAHRRCSREVLSPHVPRTDLEPPARTFLPPTGADVHSHHAAPSTASACRHTRPPIRSPGCWPHQPFYCPTAECIRPTRWTPPKRRRPPDHTLFARKRQIPAYANGTASAPLIRRTEWGSAAPRWRKARE